MKKLLPILLAFVLLFTCFASCGEREAVDLTSVTTVAGLNGVGATLAAQTGTFHIDALRAQVTDATIKDFEDFPTLLTALQSGAIDGYVAEEPTAWAVCAADASLTYLPFVNNTTGFTATDADVGIAVAFRTGSAYVARVNAIIAGISEETRAALMQQMVSIADDPTRVLSEPLALTSTSTGANGGTLKIAMECAYQPYNWTQTTDANGAVRIANGIGYANGYDVQVAKYIAAELGMTLEVYAYEWDSLIPAVQSGNVDGIIAGMSPTAAREEEVDFTDCYWISNLVVIIKK